MIESGKSLMVEADAHKWKLKDDWLPGKYTMWLFGGGDGLGGGFGLEFGGEMLVVFQAHVEFE